MKHNRLLSFLLIFALLASVLTGCFTASAAGNTTNTGTRHELCEALSEDAEAYYTGSNTWENLSAFDGIETDSSVAACGSDLFNALHNLMRNTLSNTVTYTALTSYWKTTDASNGSSDASLFYSDIIGSGYNREHVWPKSHGNFYQSGAGSDLHHLRPTNSSVNSTRSHWTFGNVREVCSSYTTCENGGQTVLWLNSSYSGNDCLGLVEVKDDVKGDVARILLYVYVTYGTTSGDNLNLFTKTLSSGSGNNANTGDKIIYDLDTLLEWCENDPVDTWEMSRNDCCAAVQGNRNVFIDYPEFAWLLFGQDVPDMDTPSGMAHEMQTGSSYTVTAVSSNETMGTVTGSGRSFTAVPAEGYYVSGYTLEPEDAATVTQNGNSFRISKPTEDCTLTVLFAAKEKAVLTYEVPDGVSIAPINSYLGETVILGTPAGTPDDDTYTYSFLGWATAPVSVTTDKPTYLPAGSEYRLTQKNETLYALYTYTVSDGGEPTDEYSLAYTVLDGSYVIAAPNSNVMMTNNNDSGTYLAQKGAVIEGNYVMNATDDCIFRIESVGDSYAIYDCNDASLFASGTKKIDLDPELTEVTADDTDHLWKISIDDSGAATITCAASASYGSLQYNAGAPRFTLYTSSQQKISLYGGITGTRYYLTIDPLEPNVCKHENTEIRDAVEPTCTKTGYSGDIWCLDCSELVEEGFVLEMTDHHYVDGECIYCGAIDPAIEHCAHENTEVTGAVEPTCTEPGYTGDTWCLDCHQLAKAGSTIEPLGHDWDDGVLLPNAVQAVCPYDQEQIVRYTCLRCGDTRDETIPALGCPSAEYSDIGGADKWYHNAADFVLSIGIMGSTSNDVKTFEPMTKVSRCMVASILYRIAGDGEVLEYQGIFKDVEKGKWYTTAIEWCAKNGLASGKGDGIFDPMGDVTRQELAVFMYKLAEFRGGDVSGKADLSSFADASSVLAWSKDYLAWAVDAGIISGQAKDGKTFLKPTAGAMRCELASILMRFLAE